jgi:hypothetical protein
MNCTQPLTADYLKRQANRLKKARGIPHHVALDEVCQLHRYANWQHFLNSQSAHTLPHRNVGAGTNTLTCPHCFCTEITVYAVVTKPTTVPEVSMQWLPIEKHSDGVSPSGITQTWGTESDMRCASCNFEGVGAQFGFTGDDLHLNPMPAGLGLFPARRILQATARLENDGTILYSQEDAKIKERPLRADEVARQLRANGAFPENIEQFLSTLSTVGSAEFSQRKDSHKFFAG